MQLLSNIAFKFAPAKKTSHGGNIKIPREIMFMDETNANLSQRGLRFLSESTTHPHHDNIIFWRAESMLIPSILTMLTTAHCTEKAILIDISSKTNTEDHDEWIPFPSLHQSSQESNKDLTRFWVYNSHRRFRT